MMCLYCTGNGHFAVEELLTFRQAIIVTTQLWLGVCVRGVMSLPVPLITLTTYTCYNNPRVGLSGLVSSICVYEQQFVSEY